MKYIAVLLTVHNRKECTEKALSHLFQSKMPNDVTLDVYLTDDGCTDGTAEMIQQEYPSVRVVKGDGNLYWNRGMYKAWEEATLAKDYDYYLWLNDDTYIEESAIQRMLDDSHSANDKAIIAGATRSLATGECTYGLHDEKTGALLVPNGSLQRGKNLNGNFVLVPKYVFLILGNLDPYYHHAGGDTDYGLRAKECGIDVLLLSSGYIGYCEQHPVLSIWCNPDIPFQKRWKALNRPTGMPLKILFYHERRHYGFFVAVFHVCTTILHCLIPHIWKYQ